jgi:hypothetical protein
VLPGRRDGGGGGRGEDGSDNGDEEEAAGPHGFVMFEDGLERGVEVWASLNSTPRHLARIN